MSEQKETDFAGLRKGLAKIRVRRWILWGTILIYVPGLLIVLDMGASSHVMGKLFALWIMALCVAVGLATVVKCPACLKPFHTNGPTFLPVRRCVHCGLHVHADKKSPVVDRYSRPD